MNILNVNNVGLGIESVNRATIGHASVPIDSNTSQMLEEILGSQIIERVDESYQIALKIWNEIEKSENIVILTHKNADGDAVGSGLALLGTLQAKYPNKEIKFVVPPGIPSMLKGLPGADSITTGECDYFTDKNYLAIMVDCDEETVDGIELYNNASLGINIDHHQSNINIECNLETNNIALITAKGPSTTEVIYNKLFKPFNIEVLPAAAECLLTGLLTDTGAFKYIKEGSNAIETKDDLIKLLNKDGDFSVWTIMDKMDENRLESEELNSLFGHLTSKKMINSVTANDGKNVGYIIISQNDLESFNIKDSKPDIKNKINGAINDLRRKTPIAAVFWETGDGQEIKVSMRSDDYVVNDFAEIFGGGGHAHAAGISIHGQLESVVEQVIAEIQKNDFA